ncbi:hypothetical protein [Hymenobacter swuensis]|uniref:AlgX/AlgJ SGNH hydrolase-like domain-containing protein n=1 Tax=Hymenobacter swuensis DY53 TaxID=1227739 RepID=W8EXK9_9BACT|nr:hypothetical protein [Hymenobacter swuensis]AHJ97839.1 hypothetical protein Hsw_2244 [Hymenobacter swuensis DY53]
MKRILLFSIAALFLGIGVLSSNTEWMKALGQYRADAWPTDKYRYGDLYGLSYLPHYKTPVFKLADLKPDYVKSKAVSNVHLYTICDSYIWAFLQTDSLLAHADAYRFSRLDYEGKRFHLDSTKKNVLVLEMVERRVRYTLPDTTVLYQQLEVVASRAEESTQDMKPVSWVNSHLFNKDIESNLEFNLFDYPLFTPLKEVKAKLNQTVFNRISPDVFISPTRDRLYYQKTIDTTLNSSSFNPLPREEEAMLVKNFNQVYNHYKRAGFDEVYLAIMPNPVTVLEPELGKYNNLIPRIQQNPALQMPVIDVYTKFQRMKEQPIYARSDTHWTKTGFLASLALIDSSLATHIISRARK